MFAAADNPELTSDVIATITGPTISANIPDRILPTNLIARFASTCSSVAVAGTNQSSGTTANDFTTPRPIT